MTLHGADNAGGPVSQQAQHDLTTAYNTAAGATPFNSVATELGGSTLDPGVYRSGTLGITGTLTLDTHGNPAAVFIFQASSTLITASASNMVFLNGASSCNVYWQVGSSATLGSTSHLIGTVMAQDAITADTGATIEGRLLARTASVTLDHNTITRPVCAAAAPTTTTASGGATTTTPARRRGNHYDDRKSPGGRPGSHHTRNACVTGHPRYARNSRNSRVLPERREPRPCRKPCSGSPGNCALSHAPRVGLRSRTASQPAHNLRPGACVTRSKTCQIRICRPGCTSRA